MAEFFRDKKFHLIVSVDPDAELYERKGRGVFGDSRLSAVKGLATLIKSKCSVSVSSVIHENLKKDLIINFLNEIKNIGINAISINIDNCQKIINPIELAHKLNDAVDYGRCIGLSVGGMWAAPLLEVLSDGASKNRVGFCSASSKSVMFIKPQGIYVCDYHPDKIGEHADIAKIVGNKINEFDDIWGQLEYCRGCEIEGFCAPCLLERDHLHSGDGLFMAARCEFYRECFRVGLMSEAMQLTGSVTGCLDVESRLSINPLDEQVGPPNVPLLQRLSG